MRGSVAFLTAVVAAASCAHHEQPAVWEEHGTSEAIRVEPGYRGARVVDTASGIGIRFDLATTGAMRIVRGVAGVEDTVRVSGGATSIAYDVSLEGDARLRFVGNVVELLDATGTPRVRVSAREVRDATNAAHAARLAIEECAFDRNPVAPWGRPTVLPGSRTCRIRVSWAEGLAQPVTVDPGWMSAKGKLSTPRTGHTSTTLPDGRVLIAGGVYGFGDYELATAELFDPATQTFASTGSMSDARYAATANRLKDGRVLVAAGLTTSAVTASADLYDPMTGTFTPTGALPVPRYSSSSLTLSTGEVVIAGGYDVNYTTPDDLLVYANGAFTNAGIIDLQGNLAGPPGRIGATLTELPNGDVLIAGGTNFENTMVGKAWAVCALFHPNTKTFEATGSMQHARYFGFAFPLPNGRVWVAGGNDPADNLPRDSVEIYDPQSKTFADHGKLRSWRTAPATGFLPDGHFFIVGGGSRDATGSAARLSNTSEVYDPIGDALHDGPSLPYEVAFNDGAILPKSMAFPNGGLLVAGGSTASSVLDTAGVIELGAPGGSCKSSPECASGRCDAVDRCCATSDECTGGCHSCSAADGICAPNARFEDDPGNCEGDRTCDGAGGCAAKNGRTCATAADCASGQCTEGVCCESACNEPCGSCVLDGRKGSCLPVPVGTKPRDNACKWFEGCSGRSTGCTSPTCADSTSSRSVDGQIVGCAPYFCGPDGACLVSCTTAADCVSPLVCDRGRCVASRFDVGAAGCSASGASTGGWIAALIAVSILARRRRRTAALVAVFFALAKTASADNWDAVGQLKVARFRSTAVQLANGNVWITAGCDDTMPASYCANGITSTTEIWDGKQSVMGPDVGPRYAHTVTLLPSGKVLVVGGCTGPSRDPVEGCDATASTLLCDVPGSCTQVTNGTKRAFHTATRLADGRVLLAGGFDAYGLYGNPAVAALDTTQIYDPQQNALQPGPTMSKGRGAHAAVELADGRVFLVGGAEKAWDLSHLTWFPTNTTEIFDPKTNQLAANPPVMSSARIAAAAIKLGNDNVLVVSGHDATNDLDTAELFDAQANTFAPVAGKLTGILYNAQGAWLSGLGKALIVGEFSNTYDPTSKTFGDLSQLAGQVREYGFVQISPLTVLIAGGHQNQNTPPTPLIQMFQLRSDGAPCMKDLDCNNANCIDGTCCAPECDGRCVGCTAGTGTCTPIANGLEHGTCRDLQRCDGQGVCKTANGHACVKNEDCLSGTCADGVCCSTACTASCLACDRAPAGSCLPIVGLPGLGHRACPPGTACGGGSGECVPSICDGDHTIRVGEKTIDCTPYRCDVTGRCLERCSSTQHCVAPYACTANGLCDKPAFDRGAGCDTTGSNDTWFGSVLAMGIVAWIRSRRVHRRSG